MNKSTFLPDRVISIPWLAFKYEGVSLSQLIYSPNASNTACDNTQDDMHSAQGASSSDSFTSPSSSDHADGAGSGVLIHPTVSLHHCNHSQKFWKALRSDSLLFKTIIYKTLLALRSLHRLNVIHRDIKPENVLLSHLRMRDGNVDCAALTVKLVSVEGDGKNQIDFGSAIFPPISALYPVSPSMEQCTKLYAPPEAESNTFEKVEIWIKHNDQSYDMWSIGVMMLEMIFGHKQFFECEPRTFAKFKFHYVRE